MKIFDEPKEHKKIQVLDMAGPRSVKNGGILLLLLLLKISKWAPRNWLITQANILIVSIITSSTRVLLQSVISNTWIPMLLEESETKQKQKKKIPVKIFNESSIESLFVSDNSE